uniref:CX domain-containing protein n=1 Tax=Panagrolaimus sp. ES5 TaxID=591445 RepID=A0AC34G2R3_9BILA
MEISAQQESKGILYEGYTDEFKLCIFEDGIIQGRNERYEFRCDAHLECCGRSCCIPTDATIPLWLLLLFIILGLLLLCLLLSALAYWFSKRPRKPKIKKDYRSDLNNSGYRTIRHVDDDANKEYSALDETAADKNNANGYGNRGYDISSAEQGRRLRRRGSESDEEGGGYFKSNINPNSNVNTSHLTRYPNDPPPRRNSWHEHETYEEEFKEEIEYERSAASSPTSSRERLTKI